MIIWLAILIPVINTIILLSCFNRMVVWWEFVIPFIASIILILICKQISFSYQTAATEYLGYYITSVNYYEPWNELVTYTESYTDSNGKRKTRTKTKVVDHGPEWTANLNSGGTTGIGESIFIKCKRKWNNSETINLNRKYHTVNGNLIRSNFVGGDDKLEPLTLSHTYENRIQASNSVFKFKTIDPTKSKVFEYCTGYMLNEPIQGEAPDIDAANRILTIANAKYGVAKQVRILVLIFKDSPIESALIQENYWKGGNKNEFVVCIGLNANNTVSWCYPFSWTEKDELKISIRNKAINMRPFELVEFTNFAIDEVMHKFERKHFSDFNYITIEPGLTALIVTFVLTILINIGCSMFVVMNDVTNR